MKKAALIILSLLILGVAWSLVLALDTGAISPGTTADDSAVGTIVWTNPNNSKVSDNVYAIVTNANCGIPTSHYLKATNFGFSIPAGATINGIVVEIEKKHSGGAGCP